MLRTVARRSEIEHMNARRGSIRIHSRVAGRCELWVCFIPSTKTVVTGLIIFVGMDPPSGREMAPSAGVTLLQFRLQNELVEIKWLRGQVFR